MRSYGGFERRESPYFAQEKPVKEGEVHEVEITEVGSKGDGITKIKNFVVFVPGTKKGDKIKVKITSVKRSCAVAERVGGAATAPAAEAASPSEAEGGSEETSAEEDENEGDPEEDEETE